MPVIHNNISVRQVGSILLYTYKDKDYCFDSLVDVLVDEGYRKQHAIQILSEVKLNGED